MSNYWEDHLVSIWSRVAVDADAGNRLALDSVGKNRPTRFERVFGVVTASAFLTLLSMVLVARLPLRDPDVWWHIVMGHAFLNGASVRHPGPMSPLGTEDWHSRDWLPQIVIAWFDDAFGLPGVAWLHGLALVALFIVCFRLCRSLVPFGPAVVATGFVFFSMFGSLSPRPQVVSFILLVVTVGALLRTTEDLRPRWWLVGLTALWACSHGMWFLSPGLQVVVLLGLVLDGSLDRITVRPHALLLALCVAAVAVTPNGIYQLTHPLGESMGIARYIQEYQPASVSDPPYVAALVMLSVVGVTWARRGSGTWVAVLLVGAGMFLTVYTGRTIALGAILLVPFFARAVASWWPEAQAYLPRAAERGVVYGGALVSLTVLAFMVPNSASAPDAFFPSEYDGRLSALPDEAVLLNELGDGGYLAWKYPNLKIVGDGLSDQYSAQWLEAWFEALLGGRAWDEFVERSGADYALVHDATPLRLGLMSQGWSTVQTGQDRVLLKAPDD